ncbi:AbiH family protein [Mesorhizobium sp.]|uniref:AbiH family protein n=1 Tax=Mesorhizobium sp. TaxID=1871066 RepID=UPI0025E13967|nr:AbiH family protein [Mesorhizobium sp.]
MVQTLYVIGNGFDLHHGIESGYRHFGEYLKANDAATFEVVERYFELDADFWSDFGARLASFNIDTLAEDASEFLVSYGADKWRDSYHHDYQYLISQAVEAVSVKMRARGSGTGSGSLPFRTHQR